MRSSASSQPTFGSVGFVRTADLRIQLGRLPMAPELETGLHSRNGGLARHPLSGSSSSLSALDAEYTTLSVLTRFVSSSALVEVCIRPRVCPSGRTVARTVAASVTAVTSSVREGKTDVLF